MYFNNDVIKIRYDLIATNKAQLYKESEIFDVYQGILELTGDERVKSNTPLDSIRS